MVWSRTAAAGTGTGGKVHSPWAPGGRGAPAYLSLLIGAQASNEVRGLGTVDTSPSLFRAGYPYPKLPGRACFALRAVIAFSDTPPTPVS